MVSKILLFASVLGVINLTNGLSAPFITPCKANDEKCAVDNAVGAIPLFAAGLKEYGVATLDPLYFKSVDSSSPNLKLILSDINLTGLKNCKPNILKHNRAESNIQVQLECALNLDGDYEMSGQILLLNIAGKGKIHVLLRKLVLDLMFDVGEKTKDGQKYYRIKKFTHTYELKEKSDVVFEGLFQDNAVLSKATEEVIKNGGNEVVNEIGGEMFKAAITSVVENVNHFFAVVPINELSLD